MIEPVRFRWEFELLTETGRFRRSGPLGLRTVADDELLHPRVAYAIGRHVGSAVVRNRVRRRLRAVMRAIDEEHGLPGGRYLVVARSECDIAPFATLEHHLRRLVNVES